MKNKNGIIRKQTQFAIRKLSIGVASVLISTGVYVGTKSTIASAATVSNDNSEVQVNDDETSGDNSVSQSNQVMDTQTTDQGGKDVTTDSQETESLKSAPVYTTQNTVPELNVNNLFTSDQLENYGIDQYDENTKVSWQTKPDVSTVGNTTGVANLSYADMNSDSETPSLKNTIVNVPVLVRKSDVTVNENEVENSLNVINSEDNSLVAHYDWVGTKAASDDEESEQIPNADDFETDLSSILQYLGFENDEGADFPYDITTFGTKNKTATMFVHPVSDIPAISDSPYFMEGNGDSTIDNVTQTPAPASYISNLGALPVGTKIEWKVAPTYDYAKDEDGNYINYEPTNDPSIEVALPGKDPIILDGETLKEVANLPAYGDTTLLINSNNEVNVGQTVANPTAYITNLDSFIKSYLEQDGEDVTDSSVNDFKNSFKWTAEPLTSQAGYTFGMMSYGAGVTGIPVLFKVNPISVDNTKTITRTINYSGLPKDYLPKNITQTATFTQKGSQTYIDQPIDWISEKSSWDAITINDISYDDVTYKPVITIDGKQVSSIDKVKDLTQDSPNVNVLVQYRGSSNGDVVSQPEANPLVVVTYKTSDDQVIKQDSYEGKVGEKVNFTIPEGYTPVESLPDVTITKDLSPITVVVAKKQSGNGDVVTQPEADPLVVVTYKTSDDQLIKQDSYEGKVGEKVNFTIPEGYTPVESLPDVTITKDLSPITVVVAKKQSGNGDVVTQPEADPLVVVTYKTSDDQLIKQDSYEGKVGEKVNFTIPEGYTPVESLPDVTITKDLSPITVVVAKKQSDNGGVVTQPEANPLVVVTYKTSDDQVIKQDSYEGKVGEKVNFTIPEGYTPVESLPDVTITKDLSPITVVVAKKQSDNGGVVTQPEANPLVVVTYKLQDGTVIRTDSYEGKVGEKVNFTIPEGYAPVESLPNITVTKDLSPITVVVAKKQSDNGDGTTQPTDPVINNTPNKDSNPTPTEKPVDTNDTHSEVPKNKIESTTLVPTRSDSVNKKPSVSTLIGKRNSNEVKNSKLKTQKTSILSQTSNSNTQATLVKGLINSSEQARLPQTGSKTAAVLLGLASLTGGIALAFISKRKKN